ncbi:MULTISPECIES: hypothetical protein [unclassified Rothia (in: high G+C Gram-positive bacteria)]|uniref:hypothetical protein n=1 Tax=unclassified Rothia (in: high G+C Gram-positive bacteria) TaxID=2689056 RepID=UPI00195E54B4|nr:MULTISPECIES: hypothetical protein [unclassified Rothia (in: high G+C Gram-positive bacteria)]MBM7050676.1 hypothetical protein [Rothia sp. ZJ1223]QRZ60864.1 hypothetical protein JR346_06155 [Rothia sp. ZJ932]
MLTPYSSPDDALEAAQQLIAEGKLEDALPALDAALDGFTVQHEKFGVVLALKIASETNRDLNRLDTAVEQMERAYYLLKELKPTAEQVGDFATETGSIYAQMGLLDESEQWYSVGAREYAAHARADGYAHNMICLAGIYRQRGDEVTARAQLATGITVLKGKEPVNTEKVAEIHLDIAHSFMAEGKLSDAESSLALVLEYATKTDAHLLVGEAYQGLAIVKAQQEGLRRQAHAHAQQAIDAFELAGDSERADFARHIHERTS